MKGKKTSMTNQEDRQGERSFPMVPSRPKEECALTLRIGRSHPLAGRPSEQRWITRCGSLRPLVTGIWELRSDSESADCVSALPGERIEARSTPHYSKCLGLFVYLSFVSSINPFPAHKKRARVPGRHATGAPALSSGEAGAHYSWGRGRGGSSTRQSACYQALSWKQNRRSWIFKQILEDLWSFLSLTFCTLDIHDRHLLLHISCTSRGK